MSHRRVRGFGLVCFAAVSVLAMPSRAAASEPTPPGKLVDLGGHRLHVNCTGSGRPTVVVEVGLGDFSFDWILVQQRVVGFARICTYDRAGYAFSDPGPKPRTYAQLNLELHDALQKLGERGPFVLVGHSFGGPVVRNYAATYPKEASGMVLVDTVQEDERIPINGKAVRIWEDATGKAVPAPREAMTAEDRPVLPPPSQINPAQKLEPPLDRLPTQEQQMQLWASNLPSLRDAGMSEIQWSPEFLLRMHNSHQDGALGSIPLIVLTRAEGGYGNDLDTPAAELDRQRLQQQAKLVRLSSRGKQIIVKSGHDMELEAPDVVADAIRQVVDAAR